MELNLFWKFFITITVFVSAVAFISLNVKKMIEKFREFKIQQRVTVMPIVNQNTDSSMVEVQPGQSNTTTSCFKFNNSKYNDPMITGKEGY